MGKQKGLLVHGRDIKKAIEARGGEYRPTKGDHCVGRIPAATPKTQTFGNGKNSIGVARKINKWLATAPVIGAIILVVCVAL